MRLLRNFIVFLFVTFFKLAGVSAVAQSYQSTLHIQIPLTPALISINGESTCYYELYITNFSPRAIHLKKLEVIDAANAAAYFTSQGTALRKRFAAVGVNNKDTVCVLPPGASSILYIEMALPANKKNFEVEHRFHIETALHDSARKEIIQGIRTSIAAKRTSVIGAPLADGTWTAIYEPSWETGHRRFVYTLNGKARIPGRFAIDLIKVNEEGNYATGNEDSIANWLGYGAHVLAVADGVVSSIKNDFPESKTIAAHPDYTADKATGNYISLKIADSLFAFYEHLQPGSIKVKPGQRVKKGDVIASLGFTGQSTGPHLHFHIANHDSPLGAEGVPFVFEQFTYRGVYENLDNLGKNKWTLIKTDKPQRRNERPAPNSVVAF